MESWKSADTFLTPISGFYLNFPEVAVEFGDELEGVGVFLFRLGAEFYGGGQRCRG